MYDNVLVPSVYQFYPSKKLQTILLSLNGDVFLIFCMISGPSVHPMFWNMFFEVDIA